MMRLFMEVLMVENMSRFVELLPQSQDIAIVFDQHADLDALAAATSLCLALQEAGKSARLFAPTLPSSDPRLTGLDQVLTTFGHQNLLVSFDYSEDKVDKISYHIGEETNKFYLTIKPKKGAEPLSSEKVEFSYSGAEPDMIIAVGVSDLESLDSVYLGYEDTYANTTLVSINEYETSFGVLQLSSMGISSLSELVVELLQESQLQLTPQIASNLLLGIEDKTRGLRYGTVTAESFAAVADLLRAGGSRTWTPVRELEPTPAPVTEKKIAKQPKSKSTTSKKARMPEEMTVSVSRK